MKHSTGQGMSQDPQTSQLRREANELVRWESCRELWTLREGVVYLNHGAFGPSPRVVIDEQQRWRERLESEPAEFYVRHLLDEIERVTKRLGQFVGTSGDNLILVDNATAAMNIIAASVPLAAGDEVLLSDHDYGAVRRLWSILCDRYCARLVVVPINTPLTSAEAIVDAYLAHVTPRTKLAIISHVTSPTALVLPVERICRALRAREITVCVDGPHALAMQPLEIDNLDCDFYTASCHKWLCAPFGTGFLYAHPRVQPQVRPMLLSWGTPPEGEQGNWRDEFIWLGTRDPSANLSIPAAIEFIEQLGLERFRERTHAVAQYARNHLVELTGEPALSPDDSQWYGSMVAIPLPPGPVRELQDALWLEAGIEVPVTEWNEQRLLRVSCHAYTQEAEIDQLAGALEAILPRLTTN